MGIMKTCCFFKNVWNGSFASAIYTMIYFAFSSLILLIYVIDEREYLVGARSKPNGETIIEKGDITKTHVIFNIIVLICSIGLVVSSILMVFGLKKLRQQNFNCIQSETRLETLSQFGWLYKGKNPYTYLASSESCSAYIYCDGDNSSLDECDDGEYFDVEAQECSAKENVYCPLDDEGEGGEGDGDNEDPDKPEEPEEVITSTLAPTTTTTTAPEVVVTTPMDILDIPPVVKDTCPAIDDPNQIVLIANENTCSDYYVCYHGHALEMHCMDHLHFNILTGKCDFPENAHCKNKREYLLPWILLMVGDVTAELFYAIYFIFSKRANFDPIVGFIFTMDLFIVCLNTYCLLCVVSQYQEYKNVRNCIHQECNFTTIQSSNDLLERVIKSDLPTQLHNTSQLHRSTHLLITSNQCSTITAIPEEEAITETNL